MRQQHDQRYKKVFSNPIFIEKLLTSFVHQSFVKDLDFLNMVKLDKSFIDKHMKERESDLVYKIYFKGKPIYLYLLLEFQSSVDKTMPLRFLRYILELTETYGKDTETNLYPAVFPLLIYNGEEKWTAKFNSRDVYSNIIPKKFIPSFEYYPIIINKIDKKTLLKIHNAVSAIFLLENTPLEETHKAIDELVVLLKDSSPAEVRGFTIWINSLFKDRGLKIPEEIINKIEKPKEVSSMFATTLERMEQEFTHRGEIKGEIKGEVKGKVEGKLEVAENLLKSGFGLEQTSNLTGISIEELKNLTIN